MQVVLFTVTTVGPGGHVEAAADKPGIRIDAPTMEELHHEARDALIKRFGMSHIAYRVVISNGFSRVSG
jgi:hypothetical protein